MKSEIEVGGAKYPVALNMGALARIASALGVKKFADLQHRLGEINLPDMPIVVAALLKANGHDVSMQAIEEMPPMAYLEQVIPAIFPRKDELAEANPPTSPAPTA